MRIQSWRARVSGTSTSASVTMAPASSPWRVTAPSSSVIGTASGCSAMVTASPRSSKPPRPVSIRVPGPSARLATAAIETVGASELVITGGAPATTPRSVFGTSRCTK